jgi:hypothetical protein
MWSAPPVERGFFPLDEELALPAGSLSPRLAESVVLLGTLIPFEQVPTTLAFFSRVALDEDTARRRTEAAGMALVRVENAEAERIERDCPPAPSGPALQQLSADGAMVSLLHGEWAEVKTLVIGTVGERVEQDGSRVAHTEQLSYFSRLTDARTFTRLAVGEIHRRGTERAAGVCAVMDGAEWLQGLVDEHRPDAVRILDFGHAAEHLGNAARAVFGVGTAAASEWLGEQLHELKHGDPDQVLAALRAVPVESATRPEEAAASRDDEMSYLEKRRQHIAYAEFLERGYPIGSGIVESANKLVVEARLKGSGMHWSRPNVDPMLALRTALRSGRWAQAWQQVTQELQRERGLRQSERRKARHPVEPEEPAAAPVPSRPKTPKPKRLPAIPLEPKGLMKNGRPTANHPWSRQPLSHRAQAANA